MTAEVTVFVPRPEQSPPTEARTRRDLAACYRLIAHFGMDDLISTHISARVPGTEDQFLINPYGLMFSEVTASNLVKVDRDGTILESAGHGVNQAGFVIHGAIHMARPDVACVLHCHTRAGMAVACMEDGLLPITQFALQFYDRVAYHAYEGVALELGERERLIADLGDRHVMILRNHGLLTAGRSVAEAFILAYYLEKACQVQVAAMASGAKLVIPPPEVCELTARQFDEGPEGSGLGEWPTMLRLLDRVAPDYKT